MPSDHPLYVTTLNKHVDTIYKEKLIERLFAQCDLLLLIGYDFGEDL